MFSKITKHINKRLFFSPVTFLVLLEFIIFALNFKPGGYLIGWDNILPEFDFWLNLKRSLFSLWQEYRGLGLLDGLAHSANLMHTLYIGFLSLFLPDSLLRFVYIHATHLVGGNAFFYLVKMILTHRHSGEPALAGDSRISSANHQTDSGLVADAPRQNDGHGMAAAFLGALFYMLNLGVIQMYFAPLEVFATHFAALPVMVLFLYRSLLDPSRKNFLLLFLASLLTTPQGFVPTVFLVYIVIVAAICGIFLIKYKNFKQVAIISLILFASNAFWLVPYLYSGIKTSPVIQQTRINQFASEEIYYRNRANGDLNSVLSLKGFMIDTIEYDPQKNKDVFFMDIWRTHQKSVAFILTNLVFLLIGLVGVYSTFRTKRIFFYPFYIAGAISLVFLANDTFLLSQLNTLIRTVLPVVGEAFRFPFTKFITLFAFCLAVFVGVGIDTLIRTYTKFTRFLLVGVMLLLLFLSYPVFLGNFTSPLLRLVVPQDYFKLFSYMKTKSTDRRVIVAPLYSFWNWQYRNWGHRGSGFLWYGIPQPITERAFDPWSEYDEQLYNEVSYGLNAQDNSLFEKTLQKYDVTSILLDQTMRNTLARQPINYNAIKGFLNKSPAIRSKKQFGELTLYILQRQEGFVYTLPSKTPTTASYYKHEHEDVLIQQDNYVETRTSPDTIPLFPSLATEKKQKDLEFDIKNNSTSFTISSHASFPYMLSDYVAYLPSLFEKEFLIPVSISVSSGKLTLYPTYPTISINNQPFTLYEEPIILTPKTVKNPKKITFLDIKHALENPFKDQKSYLMNKSINAIELEDGQRKEIVYIDTAKIAKNPIKFPFPESPLSEISVEIEKLASPLASENVIKEKSYKIAPVDITLHPYEDRFGKTDITEQADGVHFTIKSSAKKLVFYRDNLFHQASYLLSVNNSYKSGLPVNFYLDNPFAKRAEIETLLTKDKTENVIVIPKIENFYKGYGFHFTVKSVGKEVADSTIQKISLYPFPAQTLRGMRLVKTTTKPEASEKTPATYTKANPSSYIVTNVNNKDGYLVLSQGFDEGWKAYEVQSSKFKVQSFLTEMFPFLFGKELKEHVLINNWANGWKLSDQRSTINDQRSIIVYLPQYFGFVGLMITGVTLVTCVFLFVSKLAEADRKKVISL